MKKFLIATGLLLILTLTIYNFAPTNQEGCRPKKNHMIIRYGTTCSGKDSTGYFSIPRDYVQACNVKKDGAKASYLGYYEQKLKLKIPLKDILPETEETSTDFVEMHIVGGDSPIGCAVHTDFAQPLIMQTIDKEKTSALLHRTTHSIENVVHDNVKYDLFFATQEKEIIFTGFCYPNGNCATTHAPMEKYDYAYGANFPAELKGSYFEIIDGINQLLNSWYQESNTAVSIGDKDLTPINADIAHAIYSDKNFNTELKDCTLLGKTLHHTHSSDFSFNFVTARGTDCTGNSAAPIWLIKGGTKETAKIALIADAQSLEITNITHNTMPDIRTSGGNSGHAYVTYWVFDGTKYNKDEKRNWIFISTDSCAAEQKNPENPFDCDQ